MRRVWPALVLLACTPPAREAAPPGPAIATAPVEVAPVVVPASAAAAAGPVRVPALLAAAHGDGLVVSNKDGLVLLDAGLKVLKVLSRERGRYLRISGDQLYFFELKQPRLRALDLETGATRAVAELPRLRNECFEGGRPVDPIDYVHSEVDLGVVDGALCLDLSDRPGAAATETFNLRVDLRSGAVEQRMVAYLGGDVCGVEREREQPRLCAPSGPPRAGVRPSPTGRWALRMDSARGDVTDEAYALVLLQERASGRDHVIVGRKLRALAAGADAPVDACKISARASATWLAGSDVLLVEGCRDRLSVVHPDGQIEYRLVDGYVAVPAGAASTPAPR